jgi:transcriptional regulator with XRE-family HTH domain
MPRSRTVLQVIADVGIIKTMSTDRPDPITAGRYLTSARERRGLTRVQLAEASGVSNPYISQLERGIVHSADGGERVMKPRRQTLLALAEALGLNTDQTREFLGLWGFEYRGEILSALGDPHDLTTEQVRQLHAVTGAILKERERAERAERARADTAAADSTVRPVRPAPG